MVNTATTSITKEDMHKVFELSKHEPLIIDFSKIGGEEEGKEE